MPPHGGKRRTVSPRGLALAAALLAASDAAAVTLLRIERLGEADGMPAARFAELLDRLDRGDVRVVPLGTALEALRAGDGPGLVALTVRLDGPATLALAVPALAEAGLPWTLAFDPARIGASGLPDWEALRRLQAAGTGLAPQPWGGAPLAGPEDAQRRALNLTLAAYEAGIGAPAMTLDLPAGVLSREGLALLRARRVETALGAAAMPATAATDPLLLPQFPLAGADADPVWLDGLLRAGALAPPDPAPTPVLRAGASLARLRGAAPPVCAGAATSLGRTGEGWDVTLREPGAPGHLQIATVSCVADGESGPLFWGRTVLVDSP